MVTGVGNGQFRRVSGMGFGTGSRRFPCPEHRLDRFQLPGVRVAVKPRHSGMGEQVALGNLRCFAIPAFSYTLRASPFSGLL